MRKFITSGLAALMLGLLSTSCMDPIVTVIDPVVEEAAQQPEGLFTITATIASNSTKTALADDGQNIVWKEGDQIMVFNSSNLSGLLFTLKSGAGQTTGTFTCDKSLGAGPYVAVYPASAVGGSFPILTMTAPAVQRYAAGSFGPDANISYAISNDADNFLFKNAGGLLKLTINGDESKYIKRINLYSRGTTNADVLNGTISVKVNLLDPTNPTFGLPSFNETNGTVSLDCSANGGVQLGSSGVDFYFFLPAGALANGFQVEIIDKDGKAMLKSAPASAGNAILRSEIRPMPEFTYTPQYNSDFLTSNSEAGVWTGVKADQLVGLVQEYVALEYPGNGQYAVRNTSDDHTLRFQNWLQGYAVTLTTGASLTLNSNTQLTVSRIGETMVAPKTDLSVKVVKQFGGRTWLVDETDGNGYIIR